MLGTTAQIDTAEVRISVSLSSFLLSTISLTGRLSPVNCLDNIAVNYVRERFISVYNLLIVKKGNCRDKTRDFKEKALTTQFVSWLKALDAKQQVMTNMHAIKQELLRPVSSIGKTVSDPISKHYVTTGIRFGLDKSSRNTFD